MKDIDEHIPTLTDYASQCNRVVEFGVREGRGSTEAFLAGVRKELYSYDINPTELERLQELAAQYGVDFHFRRVDILNLPEGIPECDMLFIDTKHTYIQLKTELALYGNRAKKWLVFHDTVTFGRSGEDGSTPGLLQAIEEFLAENTEWKFHKLFTYNNGLTILRREK